MTMMMMTPEKNLGERRLTNSFTCDRVEETLVGGENYGSELSYLWEAV